MEAFCGIDVAFAKGKRLPLALCVRTGDALRIVPLKLKGLPTPPSGEGNRATLDPRALADYAERVAQYLRDLQVALSVRITRVAIDAPRHEAPEGGRRAAERAMDALGISCFATPSKSDFESIQEKAREHLANGGAESRLPHANQLWMLVGFALFRTLEREYDCIEVFPNAIVRALQPLIRHKSTPDGYQRQLDLLTDQTGFQTTPIPVACYGAKHDRLDALLAAWIASLPATERIAHGDGLTDSIWSLPVKLSPAR